MSEHFQETIWQKGRELYRDMPWREDTRPYYVLVSELMLQQTQVDRVIPKFNAFIAAFPNEQTLAKASLADVLMLWQGLGYNRRAKYLHDAAKMIINVYDGIFPATYETLKTLPGVGPNTAGAIMTYAYNQPVVFIETNVRTVYFEHFFANRQDVSDKEIAEKVRQTWPWGQGKEQPERRIYSAPGAMRKTVGLSYEPKAFYWALMDYGSWLKKQGAGRLRQSKHYKKQTALKGSVREVRGQILRTLASGDLRLEDLQKRVTYDARFDVALAGLLRDGLLTQTEHLLHLTK